MATPATGPSVLTRRGVLAAAAGTLLLGACGRDGEPEATVIRATGGPELVIGATLELSGPGAALGVGQERALAISLEAVNAKGVPVGNLRRTVRLEVLDNRSDPRLAARQATELGRRGDVHALLGGTLAETSMSVIKVAQELRLPFVSLAFGDAITVPLAQRAFIYKVTPDAGDVARRLARVIDTGGLRRVVLLAEEGLHGDSGVRAMTGALRTVGVTLADTVRLPRPEDGLARAAETAVAARTDGVVVWATAPNSGAAARALRGAGFTGQLFFDAGAVAEETLEDHNVPAVEGAHAVHPASLGGSTLANSSATGRAYRELVSQYIRRHGAYNGFAPYASDALLLITNAAKLANSVDRGRLRAYLQNQITDGMAGLYSFTPIRHSGMERHSLGVYRVDGGAWNRLS
ncbi:branched-chain amino acid ABC transporter substrate-binding protein [Micromonospora sonchi]|uniref:Branched-chain amino acid ABC transporter substrate-binding protein n=1 Tax=Micromonospora sonchi TaxID=1763543 RepID=A0A917WSA5_9ACTN|nr:ABC transporter substrate-binding protein [Micromonospora sonchi]GGM25185.1 branched-chain amino acid ABC transporter substrate-binding protein [Micromonospora sonchi]